MKARTSSRNAASSLERLSSITALPLPLLAEGPDFMLEGPGVAWLLIELPVSLCDGSRTHQAIRIEVFDRLRAFAARDQLPYPLGIDTRIDNEMGDMDVFGAKLACGGLCNRPQSELRARKRGETRAA